MLASEELNPHRAVPTPDHALWFREEIHVHDDQLKAYLRQRFFCVRDVEDIVQESYLRIWKRHLLRPVDSAKAFLFSIARHLAIDAIRHDRRHPIATEFDLTVLHQPSETRNARETACQREEVDILLQAVERLSPRTREVYLLRKFQNVPQAEIAARLRISPKTVEVHVGRANKQCEQFLRARGVIRDSAS